MMGCADGVLGARTGDAFETPRLVAGGIGPSAPWVDMNVIADGFVEDGVTIGEGVAVQDDMITGLIQGIAGENFGLGNG